MLSCSHDSDKKAGQKPVLVVKGNQVLQINSFYLQSAGFYLLRYTEYHNLGERIQ